MEYLVFRLYGPMASWGEIAVGGSRHTAVYPGKSALLGLLGAALGVERSDEMLQAKLCNDYRFAVKLLSAGQLLADYHTAQAPDSVGKFQYRTRRDELVVGKERLGTVLSTREYRTDAQAVIAVSAVQGAQWLLSVLCDSLKKPCYHLYLGRKSCPLAAPLLPEVRLASHFRQALDEYNVEPLLTGCSTWSNDKRFLPADNVCRYFWEGEASAFSEPVKGFDERSVQQLTRHDQPISRTRWQFQSRFEQTWACSEETH